MLDSYDPFAWKAVSVPNDSGTWYPGKEGDESVPTVAEQTLENAANFEAFCLMLRRALLMVVRWIEDKYGTGG